MNLSATLNSFRVIAQPTLALPHIQVPTFSEICFHTLHKEKGIKAVVLDKDNCFSEKHGDLVWPEYKETFDQMKQTFPPASLLIVSNSAGTNDDRGHNQAKKIEQTTGVKVLLHSTKKPGCWNEIIDHFHSNGVQCKNNEIAVIGDRLMTDILMANMMGAYGVWVSVGVRRSESLICKIERYGYEELMRRYGLRSNWK